MVCIGTDTVVCILNVSPQLASIFLQLYDGFRCIGRVSRGIRASGILLELIVELMLREELLYLLLLIFIVGLRTDCTIYI